MAKKAGLTDALRSGFSLLVFAMFSAASLGTNYRFRHIGFYLLPHTDTGGEMSPSAEHRRPDHSSSHEEGPSFHDLIMPSDDCKGVTKGHTTNPGEDPLVEHILDF